MYFFLAWGSRYNNKPPHVAVEITNGTGLRLQGTFRQTRKWIICNRKLGMISQAIKRSLGYNKDWPPEHSLYSCLLLAGLLQEPQGKTALTTLILSHDEGGRNQCDKLEAHRQLSLQSMNFKKGKGTTAGQPHKIRLANHLLNFFISHRCYSPPPWKNLLKNPNNEKVYNNLLSAMLHELIRISCSKLSINETTSNRTNLPSHITTAGTTLRRSVT